MTGKIRIKTLVKFFALYNLARDRNRRLTYREVMQEIHCCKSNAYNYINALDLLFSTQIDTVPCTEQVIGTDQEMELDQ
jgi:hypothetical protein